MATPKHLSAETGGPTMIDALSFLLVAVLAMTANVPAFLAAAETARLLRVRTSKVLHWLRSGQLKGADLSENPGRGNPRWRIARDDLQSFLDDRQPKPTPKPTRSRKVARPSDWIEYIK